MLLERSTKEMVDAGYIELQRCDHIHSLKLNMLSVLVSVAPLLDSDPSLALF